MLATPAWYPYLKDASDLAAAAAPLLGAFLILLKAYFSWREYRDRSRALKSVDGQEALEGVSSGLARLSSASGRVLWGVAAVLGLTALAALLWSGSAKAAPVPAGRVPAMGRVRRSEDDAGDDGEAKAPPAPVGEPLALQLARAEVGTREWAGKRNNPRVMDYYTDAGHPEIRSDEVSWCAAFVCAMLERSGISSPKTLAARGFLTWGREVAKPYPGCVVVFWRGSPKSWQGHVGFWVGETDTHVLCLGGNQSDGVNVARFKKSQVLGYREQRPIVTSGTVKGAAIAAGSGTGAAALVGAEVAVETAAAPAADPVAAEAPGLLQQIGETLGPLAPYSRYAALFCALLAVAGGLWALKHRLQIRKETGR
jgi:uncharacterized protein (TIGR02594 family)